MLGNVAVDAEGVTNPNTVVLSNASHIARLAVITRAIQSRGTLAGIQLAYGVPQAGLKRRWKATDAASEIQRLRAMVASFSSAAIQTQLKRFIRSAALSVAAGFDIIQLHAAHGYLLSLLTSPMLNQRSDRFGLDSAWLEELISEIRDVIGDALLSVRMNVLFGIEAPSAEADNAITLAQRLVTTGVDLIDLSAGLYTLDRGLIYPGKRHRQPVYSGWLPAFAAQVDAPLVIAGRVLDLREVVFPQTKRMVISLGRAFIADPRFAEKSQAGRFGEITRCALRNRCHYFSRDRAEIECGVNPSLSAPSRSHHG